MEVEVGVGMVPHSIRVGVRHRSGTWAWVPALSTQVHSENSQLKSGFLKQENKPCFVCQFDKLTYDIYL